jgi:hypothetical protein
MEGVILALKILLVIVVGELILHALLVWISKFIGKSSKDKKDKLSRTSVLKGILERAFILVCLFNSMAAALSLLGALKIATRIKDEENKISNDFFLIGNLVSILFAVAYFMVLRDFILR